LTEVISVNNLHPGAGKSWKIIIIVIVGLFFAATAASLVIAGRKVSRVVDTDYYSKGLHYAETHGRGGNAGDLWTMTPSFVANHLQVIVRDGAGSPVTGGRVVYDLDGTTDNRSVATLHLSESGPGIYSTLRPEDAGGDFRGTMRFTRGETTITSRVVVIN
jgi:hypothetical protein